MELSQWFWQWWCEMRIGELAKRTRLSRDTIRFYERHELISSHPSRDAANSYRDYPEDLVERLEMIGAAREAGLSVADLQLLIHHMETGGDGSFDVTRFLDEKIAAVTRTVTQSRFFLKILKQTRASLDALPVEWQDKDIATGARNSATSPEANGKEERDR